MEKSKEKKVDMTSGPLARKIFFFSLPLIASGILQQSFNAVDVAVIGHYSTNAAIAAVGSNGPVISILVNLFIGIAVGANVVIANYIGEKNEDGVRRSVSTVMIVSVVSGLLLLLVGTTLARPILQAMSAPPDVIELATRYLRIFFCGMPFMMIYNFGGSILRSIGDTPKLFYSLVIATICNLMLDLLFVAVFNRGVDGVAWATVISNAVNAGVILFYLRREPQPFTVTLNARKWHLSRPDLGRMLRIGVPAGLQGMVFSISNIFIQSAINSFGADAIAGSATALTYEAYCYYIVAGFCGATIAFTGQNYGAMKPARCRRIWAICMAFSVVITGSANLLLYWQQNLFFGVFTTSAAVMAFASIRFRDVLLYQCIASSYEISGSYMRGLGYSMAPMLLTIFGTCVLRLIWVSIYKGFDNSFGTLLSIYPISWVITGILVVAAAFLVQRRAFRRLTADRRIVGKKR